MLLRRHVRSGESGICRIISLVDCKSFLWRSRNVDFKFARYVIIGAGVDSVVDLLFPIMCFQTYQSSLLFEQPMEVARQDRSNYYFAVYANTGVRIVFDVSPEWM